MVGDYKTSKEAFVSGTTGSNVLHVNLILAVGLSSIALHSAIRTRFPPSKSVQFITDVLVLVLPLLLSITLFAENPGWLSVLILTTTGVLLCFPRPESGTPLPSSQHPSRSTSPVHGQSRPLGSPAQRQRSAQIQIPPLPALTIYRAYMLLLTFLCILAVDFPVFPRSLAKCETFGVSLMDLGVGGFVFSQGVVSAIPLLKDDSYLTSPVRTKTLSVLRKSLPIVVLGVVRVLLVKGTEYPEHESEYGTHWNFFITLAVLSIFQIFLHPFIAFAPVSMMGVLVAFAHQIFLFLGLENYILTASRTNLINANKEGIVSVMGYLAIHLLGLSTGTIILPASPSYFRRQQKARQTIKKRRDSNAGSSSNDKMGLSFSPARQSDKTATELASYAVVWWSMLGLVRFLGIGTDVSRRMANLPYILWVAAVNTTLILAFLLLDMYNFPSPAIKSMQAEPESFKLTVPRKIPEISIVSPPTQVPLLLEAVNKNGLVLFLAANVATGLVNLSLPTMYMSQLAALSVLICYTFSICGVAWAFRNRRIWR